MPTLLEHLRAAGLQLRIDAVGRLCVAGPMDEELRHLVADNRDELVGQLRVEEAGITGLPDLVREIIDDVAAVDAARATWLEASLLELLETDPVRAAAEIARCWSCLIRLDLPAVGGDEAGQEGVG